MKLKKVIKDTIHKQIFIEKEYLKYFNSYVFQRLRFIKQTSFLEFVYPCATHNRFSHSLGCFHLMKKFVNNDLNKIDEKTKKNLIISALLHDIGHGPFSHTFEKVFPNFNHEEMGIKLIKENFNLEEVSQIIEGKHKFSKLLSSTIDVDKLDYMLRDSYFTGILGSSDPEYIILNSYINDEEKLVVKKKAIMAIEDLISKRINIYKILFLHRNSLLKDFIFENILKRVKEIYKDKEKNIFLDENLLSFFKGNFTTKNLLELVDSSINYHIHLWKKSKDEILKKMCNNYLNIEDNFQIVNLKTQKINLKILEKEISKNYNLNYYFKHIKIPIKILENQIWVEIKENKLKKIEEVSNLIKFFRDEKFEVEYVICPKEIIVKDLESLDSYI